MGKIIVLQHSNQLGLGGTEKTMQIFCKYLDRSVFEVHALTQRFPVPLQRVARLAVRNLITGGAGSSFQPHRFCHSRLPEFEKILGPERIHMYTKFTLGRSIRKIAPHILHVHHSGSPEPPVSSPGSAQSVPVIVSTNVFGYEDPTPEGRRISRILFISQWLKDNVAVWSKNDPRCSALYYPIEKPFSTDNLRNELGIAPDTFVLGRIGRNADDIHDPIALRAYKEIENEKTLYLIISPPPKMVQDARELGLKHVKYLDPTVDDVYLSRFYNTLDVFAHARLDGETFGCAIAEDMIHGAPVVTHRSHIRNAQSEILDAESGFVAERDDWRAYAGFLKQLMQDKNLRLKMGASAKKRAMENFEAGLITRKLEKIYFEELKKTGISV